MSYRVELPAGGAGLGPARATFRRFHCFPPARLLRVRCRRLMPETVTQLGRLRAVIYRSDRRQPGRPRTFIHFFDTPPLLTCSPEGRRLYVVGGDYRVTSRGIEG
jgi:hypothetical protein